MLVKILAESTQKPPAWALTGLYASLRHFFSSPSRTRTYNKPVNSHKDSGSTPVRAITFCEEIKRLHLGSHKNSKMTLN